MNAAKSSPPDATASGCAAAWCAWDRKLIAATSDLEAAAARTCDLRMRERVALHLAASRPAIEALRALTTTALPLMSDPAALAAIYAHVVEDAFEWAVHFFTEAAALTHEAARNARALPGQPGPLARRVAELATTLGIERALRLAA